jgi:type I restriction enzyme S subunit
LDLHLPPPSEQHRIVGILDTIDDAIRKTEQIIVKLKRVKRGLLHDLLTRGVDDNGELRDPERHPEQFSNSPLGRIPKEWALTELGTVVPRATYGISESLDNGPGIPVLRMMNFKDGEAHLSDLKFSRSKVARDLLLQPGDVLFNRTNSIDHVGRTGIWRGQIAVASFASYLVRLEPDSERLRAEFLNRWLNWDATQLRIRRFATPGVHQVNINPTSLRRTMIALPTSLTEQDRAVDAMAALDARLAREETQVQKLRLAKQGLVEDLLTGRVRVTNSLENAAE